MVPEEIHKLWVKGGSQRRELAKILIEVGEDKDGTGCTHKSLSSFSLNLSFPTSRMHSARKSPTASSKAGATPSRSSQGSIPTSS